MAKRSSGLPLSTNCVDQALYSDPKLKEDIKAADTGLLLEQVKRLQVQTGG